MKPYRESETGQMVPAPFDFRRKEESNLQKTKQPKHPSERLTLKKLSKHRFIYLMLLPIAAYFIVFSYYPLGLGLYSSFHDVKLLGGSQFVGMANYANVIANPQYGQAFLNSLIVGIGTFVFQFLWGLTIALLLNEVRGKIAKSAIQSVTYIPYLLSWSVVGGLWMLLFSPSGMVNGLLELISSGDFQPIVFMSEPKFARFIMIFTGAWKGAGYYAVLFLAAIVGIDPSIYESASIDGASRLRQIFQITVPNIVPTMKVVTVLGAMGVLRNFDQIYIMGTASILDKVRNLLYLIFTQGVQQFKVGPATAAATLVLIGTMVISSIVRKVIRYDDTYED